MQPSWKEITATMFWILKTIELCIHWKCIKTNTFRFYLVTIYKIQWLLKFRTLWQWFASINPPLVFPKIYNEASSNSSSVHGHVSLPSTSQGVALLLFELELIHRLGQLLQSLFQLLHFLPQAFNLLGKAERQTDRHVLDVQYVESNFGASAIPGESKIVHWVASYTSYLCYIQGMG